jgi:hypothetical protein
MTLTTPHFFTMIFDPTSSAFFPHITAVKRVRVFGGRRTEFFRLI